MYPSCIYVLIYTTFARSIVTGVTVFLMICSTIYEYRSGSLTASVGIDVESAASLSNNNVRRAEYADKNLAEAQRISVTSSSACGGHDNDKDLIDKSGLNLAKAIAARKDLDNVKSKGQL